MPKVTAEHVEARRKQILEAARACFIRKGFHQTTMQDICSECGLSPGAIYRYFAGKAEIIEAMGQENLAEALTIIEGALSRLGTLEVLDLLGDHFFLPLETPEAQAAGRVYLESSAEALRNEQMREARNHTYRAYRDAFAQIVRRGQSEGLFNPDLDPGTVADVMIGLYQGLELMKAVHPDLIDVRKYAQVVRALCSGQFWCGPSEEAPKLGASGAEKG